MICLPKRGKVKKNVGVFFLTRYTKLQAKKLVEDYFELFIFSNKKESCHRPIEAQTRREDEYIEREGSQCDQQEAFA